MSDGAITLRIDGKVHQGFRSGDVTLSLEQGTNNFSLNYADRWEFKGEHVRIRAGDRCELAIDDEVLLDGYVDETNIEYDPDRLSFSCSGRAKTADLVDCSVVKGKSWRDATLYSVVADLARPFGIDVVMAESAGQPPRLESFTAKKGESVWDAIKRASKRHGLLPYTIGGQLWLTSNQGSRTATTIHRGTNVIRASQSDSWAERYSSYVFRSQSRARDEVTGRNATHVQSDISDDAIGRYRPLVVQAGGDGPRDMRARAALERKQRRQRGARFSYTVVGWRMAEGLWMPNTLVRVEDDWLGLSGDFRVATVQFHLDAEAGGGRITRLDLTRSDEDDTTEGR